MKCSTVIDSASSSQKEMMEDGAKSIEREKEICRVLTRHRHPNMLRYNLTSAYYLFLERGERLDAGAVSDQSSVVPCVYTIRFWVYRPRRARVDEADI